MKKKTTNRDAGPVRGTRLPFEFPGGNWYGKEEEQAAVRVIRAKSPFRKGAMPRAGDLMDRSVIIPVPSVMTKRDVQDTIDGIRKVGAAVL